MEIVYAIEEAVIYCLFAALIGAFGLLIAAAVLRESAAIKWGNHRIVEDSYASLDSLRREAGEKTEKFLLCLLLATEEAVFFGCWLFSRFAARSSEKAFVKLENRSRSLEVRLKRLAA